MLCHYHLEQPVYQLIFDPCQKLCDLVGTRVRNDDLKGLEGPQQVVIVTHQAETMQKWLDDIALLGKMDYMLAF